MKEFAFEKFIEDNGIDTQTLPQNLQKRIRGFEELKEDYGYAIDEDKDKLETTINNLALELEEDLYDEFENSLENNDYVEEQLPVPEKKKTNEDLLLEIYSNGKRKISKTELEKKGFKGNLSSHLMKIGKFFLKKETFSHTYHISEVAE